MTNDLEEFSIPAGRTARIRGDSSRFASTPTSPPPNSTPTTTVMLHPGDSLELQ